MARKIKGIHSKQAEQAALGIENTRTALYVRVSTQLQAEEGYSLEAQQERLQAYCTAQGWTVNPEHVFVDAGAGTQNQRIVACLINAEPGRIGHRRNRPPRVRPQPSCCAGRCEHHRAECDSGDRRFGHTVRQFDSSSDVGDRCSTRGEPVNHGHHVRRVVAESDATGVAERGPAWQVKLNVVQIDDRPAAQQINVVGTGGRDQQFGAEIIDEGDRGAR